MQSSSHRCLSWKAFLFHPSGSSDDRKTGFAFCVFFFFCHEVFLLSWLFDWLIWQLTLLDSIASSYSTHRKAAFIKWDGAKVVKPAFALIQSGNPTASFHRHLVRASFLLKLCDVLNICGSITVAALQWQPAGTAHTHWREAYVCTVCECALVQLVDHPVWKVKVCRLLNYWVNLLRLDARLCYVYMCAVV